jgi:hypothetical protein
MGFSLARIANFIWQTDYPKIPYERVPIIPLTRIAKVPLANQAFGKPEATLWQRNFAKGFTAA